MEAKGHCVVCLTKRSKFLLLRAVVENAVILYFIMLRSSMSLFCAAGKSAIECQSPH